MIKQYIETGKIVATHGIRGEVRVECWCDTPSFLSDFSELYLDNGNKKINVRCHPHKNIALMKIDGIDSIDDAKPLVGRIIYINRDDVKLEDGRFFVSDLLGLDVIDTDTDKVYGKITGVINNGANDIYEMKTEDSKTVYIPVIPDIVIKKDFDRECIYIRPMKGLFDDEN